MCCSAKEYADKTHEVVTDAADKAHGKIKASANEFTLRQLKEALEGKVDQVHEAPDVFVTIVEVSMEQGVGLTSLNCFHLKGLKCKAEIKVHGTAAQLAGMVAAQGAASVLGFLGMGEKKITDLFGFASTGLAEKAVATTEGAKASLHEASGGETKVLPPVDIILDLEKVLGVEEVTAKVVAVNSSHNTINKIMSLESFQKYVEVAVSKRVTKDVTDWQNNTFTFAKAQEKAGEAMAPVLAKGHEWLSAAGLR